MAAQCRVKREDGEERGYELHELLHVRVFPFFSRVFRRTRLPELFVMRTAVSRALCVNSKVRQYITKAVRKVRLNMYRT